MFLMALYFGLSLVIMLPLMITYVNLRRHSAAGFPRSGNALRWLAQSSILLMLPLIPYAIVEARTAVLGRRLMPAVVSALRELYYSQEIVAFKVLSYQGGTAEIYVVTPCPDVEGQSGFSGDTIVLHKRDAYWKFTGEYNTVWSDCGSADGNIFPPYPSKGDYRTERNR
jgi:hypothetical protein